MEIRDYAQELIDNARELKDYSFAYQRERQEFSKAINTLTNLIYKSGLHDDKASFENKLTKLLATPYAKEAKIAIEQMNTSRANYKGWEEVIKSYQVYISSIQSIIKWNLQGELTEAVKQKVIQDDIML
jgi:hypothetical protein